MRAGKGPGGGQGRARTKRRKPKRRGLDACTSSIDRDLIVFLLDAAIPDHQCTPRALSISVHAQSQGWEPPMELGLKGRELGSAQGRGGTQHGQDLVDQGIQPAWVTAWSRV